MRRRHLPAAHRQAVKRSPKPRSSRGTAAADRGCRARQPVATAMIVAAAQRGATNGVRSRYFDLPSSYGMTRACGGYVTRLPKPNRRFGFDRISCGKRTGAGQMRRRRPRRPTRFSTRPPPASSLRPAAPSARRAARISTTTSAPMLRCSARSKAWPFLTHVRPKPRRNGQGGPTRRVLTRIRNADVGIRVIFTITIKERS